MNTKFLSAHFPNASIQDWRDWRWQFQNRVTSLTHLAEILGGPENHLEKLRPVRPEFRPGGSGT